jgi:hypothetical protein
MNAFTVVPTLKSLTQRVKLFKVITLLSEEEIVLEGFVESFENDHALSLLDRTAMPRAKFLN